MRPNSTLSLLEGIKAFFVVQYITSTSYTHYLKLREFPKASNELLWNIRKYEIYKYQKICKYPYQIYIQVHVLKNAYAEKVISLLIANRQL